MEQTAHDRSLNIFKIVPRNFYSNSIRPIYFNSIIHQVLK